jgi:hypothetical protein
MLIVFLTVYTNALVANSIVLATISFGLMFFLHDGYPWARYVSAFAMPLLTAGPAVHFGKLMVDAGFYTAGPILWGIGFIVVVAAVYLFFSKHIEAYLWYRREKRFRENRKKVEELEANVRSGSRKKDV